MLLNTDHINYYGPVDPGLTRIIAIIDILFFGIGIFVASKRILKTKVAIIIDSKGLNLNPKKDELIEWKYITGLKEIKIRSTRVLIIRVINPEYWIAKETNVIKRKMMKFNLNSFESPFNISNSGLEISFEDLNKKLSQYIKKNKNVN